MSVHVCFSADSNFLKPLELAVYSVVINYHCNDICIHVIKLDDFDVANLNKLSKKYEIEIIFYNLNVKYKSLGRFSRAMYGRLFLDKLISQDVERIIYLDCDTICISDISKLWMLDMEGYPLAAVPEPNSHIKNSLLRRFSISDYFNSGVLLLDLNQIRMGGGFDKTLLLLNNKFDYPDQDALNITFADNWLPIDEKYNYMKLSFSNEAVIIHYALSKPWDVPLLNQNSYHYHFIENDYPFILPFFKNDYSKQKICNFRLMFSKLYWYFKSFGKVNYD